MKNFIISILGILVAVLVGYVFYTEYISSPPIEESSPDSVPEEVVQLPINGKFSTSTEVLIYKEQLAKIEYYDSVFIHMPDEIVDDVVTVLLSSRGLFTIDDIVDEYIKNASIYNGLYQKKRRGLENNNETSGNTSQRINESTIDSTKESTNRIRDSQEANDSTKEAIYKLVKVN